MERIKRWALAGLLIVSVVAIVGRASNPPISSAAEPILAVIKLPPITGDGLEYAMEGAGTCMDCHDESSDYPVLSILKTKHAVTADSRTPFSGDAGCESCHGPASEHLDDEDNRPSILFGFDSATPPHEQNEMCLNCHEGAVRMNWQGSPHDSENLPCVACHTIHIGDKRRDPVLTMSMRPELWTGARNGQAEVCFKCHKGVRAQMYRISSHPMKEGKRRCGDCHNPHGGPGPKQLVKPTINETCYTCHAEKRGPFLWEHAPVRESCMECHTPHGSNHAKLLRARSPFLCQQCHMAQYHPGTAYPGNGLPPFGAQNKLLATGCQNCHSEVHGSNHPSGVRWTR